jgi:hypothetical protein
MNISEVTKGRKQRAPRMILCGTEKVGKSTFAAGAPEPIFLPIKGEDGIDDLDVARTPLIETYDELMGAIKMLGTEDHEYQTVIIDSVSTLEPIIWEHLCASAGVDGIEKVGGGFGKGYVEAVGLWRQIMAGLDYLRDEIGMGCILIGHVSVRTFSDPLNESYDVYELDIHKKASGALMRWADSILFANNKVIVKTEEKGGKSRAVQRAERVLFTQRRPAHPGGGRGVYGQLPYEMDLSFGAFAESVKAKMKAGE